MHQEPHPNEPSRQTVNAKEQARRKAKDAVGGLAIHSLKNDNTCSIPRAAQHSTLSNPGNPSQTPKYARTLHRAVSTTGSTHSISLKLRPGFHLAALDPSRRLLGAGL